MDEYITLGSVPSSESCAQVGDADYRDRAIPECRAYIGAIRKKCDPISKPGDPYRAHARLLNWHQTESRFIHFVPRNFNYEGFVYPDLPRIRWINDSGPALLLRFMETGITDVLMGGATRRTCMPTLAKARSLGCESDRRD